LASPTQNALNQSSLLSASNGNLKVANCLISTKKAQDQNQARYLQTISNIIGYMYKILPRVAKSWNPVSRGWHLSPHGYGPAHASNNCWSKPKARSKLRDKALKMQSFKMSSYLLSLALWLAANSLAGTTIPQSKY